MPSRTLILTPVAILGGALLVAAIIDSGQQAGATSRTTAPAALSEPMLLTETTRIEQALASPRTCSNELDCDLAASANRARDAARGVRNWAPDPRFSILRDKVATQLDAEADLLDARAAANLGRSRSMRQQKQLDALHERRDDAYRATIQAQHAVGLLSDEEYTAARNASYD